jgi:hypothetical protein
MVSAPYISLDERRSSILSNNILLNLETIFKIDNKKLMHEEPDNPPYTSCKVRLVIIDIAGNLIYIFLTDPEVKLAM